MLSRLVHEYKYIVSSKYGMAIRHVLLNYSSGIWYVKTDIVGADLDVLSNDKPTRDPVAAVDQAHPIV